MNSNAHDYYARTTLRVDNLHCSSCVAYIADIVAGLPTLEEHKNPTSIISDVDISLQERTVSFNHPKGFDLRTLLKQLDVSGFDVQWLPSNTGVTSPTNVANPFKWRAFFKSFFPSRDVKSSQRQTTHRDICSACRTADISSTDIDVITDETVKYALRESRFALEGMTSRCVDNSKRDH